MVCGAIGLNEKNVPQVLENIGGGRGNGITAQHYIGQILKPPIILFFPWHHNHVFQQDTSPSHTASVTIDFQCQYNMRTMPWPALSLDLNPTENPWDEIQRQLNQEVPRPCVTGDNFPQGVDTNANGFCERSMYQ